MFNPLEIRIQRLPGDEDLPLPAYQTDGSAGMDLHAAVPELTIISPGERAAIPAGIRIALPPGYEAQVRGRSGLARHHGVTLANGVGTVDSDYRGPVQVLLVNLGQDPFEIRRGDRIAQMVIAPVIRARGRNPRTSMPHRAEKVASAILAGSFPGSIFLAFESRLFYVVKAVK